MTQAICDITTDEVNVDVVVEPQADTMVEVANRSGGMEQVFHDNTLIGNGNSIDLGVNTEIIASKEYVDEKFNPVDTYTKSEIDNKVTVINAGIDANADAIQKTREDYIQADSEIHQILNNHAENLTTLHNDVDDLGDQVAEIESKIPESASETNQLATKADLANVDLDGYVKKSGDTMTGDLAFDVVAGGYTVAFQDSYANADTGNTDSVIKRIQSNHSVQGLIFSETKNGTVDMQFTMIADGFFMPHGNRLLGSTDYPWNNIYAKKLNNGADVAIPTEGGTLARVEDLIDLRADINETDSELQTQITSQAAEIATKQDQLTAGDNIVISGNVISATGAGGGTGFDVQVVQELPATGQKGIIYLLAKDGAAPDVYDEYVWIETTQTFELIGTTQVDLTDYAKKEELDDYLPLSGGTVNGVVKIQNGQGTGSLWVGADVNNTTLTNNQRHLARIVVPSFTNIERGATLLGWDSSGDTNVHIANNSADMVGFGGSKKITNATSPMGISFCVAKTREATAAADKVYPLAMDANAANFDVPVSAPDLTVGTDEGTINIGVVAGTATIATNNGLDIAAQTKFDTAPTTDDTTSWADANATSFVRKSQVAEVATTLKTNQDSLYRDQIELRDMLNTKDAEGNWTTLTTTAQAAIPAINELNESKASKEDLSGYLPLSGGTMTGALNYNVGERQSYIWSDAPLFTATFTAVGGLSTYDEAGLYANANGLCIGYKGAAAPLLSFLLGVNKIEPPDNRVELGTYSNLFKSVGTKKLVSGVDTSDYSIIEIIVPQKKGTMALVEDINAIGGDGAAGQVLTKTDDGMAWADASGGDGDIDCGVMS